MQKAQEFLVDELKKAKESYDAIEAKTGVSKTTVSRMMNGQVVSANSMRTIAAAYGVLDEFLALLTAAADPKRAADELHEMYRHAEQLVMDNCDERVTFMEQRLQALERIHEREIELLVKIHEKEIESIEEANEKVFRTQVEAASGWHKRANVFTLLFGLTISVCVLMVLLLAYYIHYDLTHLDMGMFRSLLMDSTGGDLNNTLILAMHEYIKGTGVLMSSKLQLFV